MVMLAVPSLSFDCSHHLSWLDDNRELHSAGEWWSSIGRRSDVVIIDERNQSPNQCQKRKVSVVRDSNDQRSMSFVGE
jgi:hypothetical protein